MKVPYLSITAVLGSLAIAPAIYAAQSSEDFVKKASIANEFEIQSSKLALDKSQNKSIKSFAQHMVDDHTKAGDNLQSALQSSGVGLQPENVLDDKHQKLMDKLQGETGDTFNHDYVSIQTDAHKETVDLFTDYSKKGDNTTLKDFASATLPTLENHLKEIREIKSRE